MVDIRKKIKLGIERGVVDLESGLRDILRLCGPEDREWLLYVRKKRRKIGGESGLELIYRSYVIGGRSNFDDYMSRCEYYREPQRRFWWPRRKVLEGKHKIRSQIQEFIDDDRRIFLGFSMPPGTGKSTLIKFLLAYIRGKYPQSANMYVSYADGMVKMIEDSVRSILTDGFEYRHREIFPDNGTPDMSAEYHTISYRKKGDFPTIGLVSLSGSVTGRTRANKFMITDDLVKNAEMARSPERLGKLWDDYRSTLTTRTIGDNVKQIMLGTRWSIHDPIGKMFAEHENDPRYKFIRIPVMDEDGESNFEYDHPDRYTREKIEQMRSELDPVDFSCLYMQKGIEKEGLAFPYDGMFFYNGVLPETEPDTVKFHCDVAFGGGDSLSMPIAYLYGDTVYIPDVVFDRGDKAKTEPRVVSKIIQHGIKRGNFERNNGGDFYRDDISRMLRERNYRCNITTKKAPTTTSKAGRIEQYAPDIRKFYFLHPKLQSDEYRRFMEEVCRFSFTGKNLHDDRPDSLAGLARYLLGGVKIVGVRRRPF